MNEPMKRACAACGSANALASAVLRSPQFISQIVRGDRPVPAELCPAIERATNRAVRCEELRPDVDWGYLREQSAPVSGFGALSEQEG